MDAMKKSSLPNDMLAIEIAGPGGPEVLRPRRRPLPRPRAGELLIEVAAAGLNRPDILQRQGLYPAPPGVSDVPGLEVAGRVVALGPATGGWAVGQEVCALIAGGGYAEFCAAPAAQCLPVPKGLSLVEAAAIPETTFTVWTNLFERAALKAGERLLVHGGSGGIGTAAIQLARAFGVRVFATAGGAEKCAYCRSLGAERAIDYRAEDFVAVTRAATGGEGVDVILDMVGGDYLARNLSALREDGRLVMIAFLHGAKVEIDLMRLMLKRLTLTGSTLRACSIEQKGRIARAVFSNIWPLFEAGRIRPVVDRTLPLERAQEAHRVMEAGQHKGKIVLTARPI
jgi:putative PIG3 family NAD(P)H quinone oxidoreductase